MVSLAKIFLEDCTCGNQIGAAQYRYEAYANSAPEGNPHIYALQQLGWTKMCCRVNSMESPVFFLRYFDESLRDEAGVISGSHNQVVTRNNPPVVPLRELPAYPTLPGREVPRVPGRIEPLPVFRIPLFPIS